MDSNIRIEAIPKGIRRKSYEVGVHTHIHTRT